MGKHDALVKTLAIVGTVLVALPLVVPFVFSLPSMGTPGGYRIDYLMPFEVYPVTLVGLVLILWAALRAKTRARAIGAAIGIMIGGLLLASIAAQVTGIAQSVEQLEAWRYGVTIALGAVSLLGQVFLIVEGYLLARDSFAAKKNTAPPVTHTDDD